MNAMGSIRFGAVTGTFSLPLDKAKEYLRRTAEQVDGVSWNIQLIKKGAEVRVVRPPVVESQCGTKERDVSGTFTATASAHTLQEEQGAEKTFALLAGNAGLKIDVKA